MIVKNFNSLLSMKSYDNNLSILRLDPHFLLWTIYQLKKILNTDSILKLVIWSKALVGNARSGMLFQAA